MKLAHNKLSKTKGKPPNCIKLICCEPRFFLATIFIVIGSLLNTLALGLGNQILASSMGAISISLNSIMGTIILKERLSRVEILGITIACIGSFLYMIMTKESRITFSE